MSVPGPCWLDVMCQPRLSVCMMRISLATRFDNQCRNGFSLKLEAKIFSGPVITLRLTEKSLSLSSES